MNRPTSTRTYLAAIIASLASLAFLVSLLAAAPAWSQSCAMCGTAFGANDPLGRAFSWSILFLMAAPYLIFGTVGGWIFYTYRRAASRGRAAVIDLARSARPAVPPAPAGTSGGELP